MNSTKELIDKYKKYIYQNRELGLYNKNNSEKFWGNIESHYTDISFLGNYMGQGLSFFDIGCGAGQVLDFAKSLGFHKVSGIEINKELCEECAKNGFEVINENLVSSNLDFLKNFDILYFYCPIKEEGLKKTVLDKICDKMKIGSIIKSKLAEIESDSFVQIERDVYKKIK